MGRSWKTVKVFISSTFRDMQAERDQLVRFVFPKLREELLVRRIHLVDVDLRWGVTGDQDALTVCREIIDDCHPRFLCMLGGRYGWVPQGKKYSITADEVQYGVLDRLGKHGYAFFYFRDPESTRSIAEEFPGEYRESPGCKNEKLLDELKNSVTKAGLNPFVYKAKWDINAKRLTGLKEFGDQVYNDLKQSIIQEFGEQPVEKLDAFERENDAMDAFIEERTQRFVLGSRKPVLDQLVAHATRSRGNGYMCLFGVPGSGKSAMMAKLSRRLGLNPDPSIIQISHFVGASIGSTDVRLTLRRFYHEIYDQCDLESEKNERLSAIEGSDEISQNKRREVEAEYDIPEDPETLRHQFPPFLEKGARKKQIVILIDAVNQFDPSQELGGLIWLPNKLPDNACIIFSILPGPTLDLLLNRPEPPETLELSPLNQSDSRAIIEHFLNRYRKNLTEAQKTTLLSKKDADTPLYLLTALEELRTLSVSKQVVDSKDQDEAVKQIIMELPPTSSSLFTWILNRLENDDGFRDVSGKKIGLELVSQFSAVMGVTRHGLSQKELFELLVPGDSKATPTISKDEQGNVAALLHLLRPYLMHRGDLLDFYHGQFKKSVEDAYLKTKTQRQKYHEQLSDFFKIKADPERNQSWKGKRERPFRQLAFHMAGAYLHDDLCNVLCDLKYIETRCFFRHVFELQDDYRLCLTILPEYQEELRQEKAREARVARWTKEIIEYSQKWSERRDREARGENVAEPEPQLPEIIPSVKPWSEEQIQAECDRIINHPTRLDLINAFYNFVQSECYPLMEFGNHPGFVIQHAYNRLPGDPVRTAAAKLIDSVSGPTLRRRWPASARYNPKPALLKTIEGHTAEVESVSVTPDGKQAVSASSDKTLKVWDLLSGQCVKILEGHTGSVFSVCVTPNGKQAVSASRDKTLRVWDLISGQCIKTLEGHTDWVNSVSVTPDGKQAVSASDDKTLLVWDLLSGRCVKTLKGHIYRVSSVSVTPDGKHAISASWDETLRMWDLTSGQCVKTLEGHTFWVNRVIMTPDGKHAVSASHDKTLRIWDLLSGQCVKTLKGHTDWVTSVSVTPDGKQAVSASHDKTLKVWNLLSGQCVKTLEGHNSVVDSVSVTPNGKQAVSASGDKTLRIWDLLSGQCVKALKGHFDWVKSVSVTPDGKQAVSASDDKTLLVWDLLSGQCLKTLEGHNDSVYSVRVTPGGKHAVSASLDKILRVWDLLSGQCIKALKGHTDWVSSVSVMPDGKQAVSAGQDKTLRVWDLLFGQCLALVLIDAPWIPSIFSAGLNTLIGGTSTGQVAIYEMKGFNFSPAIHTIQKSGHGPTFSFRCICCGEKSSVPEPKAKIISEYMYNLKPNQSPCLDLPDSAFSDPRLVSKCPKCHRDIRFNPFYVDMD